MSFLFKNKKVNINSLTFPTFDWEVLKEKEHFKQWINKEQTVGLSINFFDSKPDLPYLDKIDVVREFYRKELSAHNGGLIEVNIKDIGSYKTIKTIFKISQEPTGISYLASLTVPFKNYRFVIKIQSLEYGMIGNREAETTRYLLKNKELTPSGDSYLEWARDPYKKDFDEGLLMNLSEQEKYDSVYANHALSKARKMINTIESKLAFDTELSNLKKLEKGKLTEAISLLNKAIIEETKEATYFSERGVCFLNLKQYEKALSDLNESVRLDPEYSYRYAIRGLLKDKIGDTKGGIEDYEIAVKLDPEDPISYNNLGMLQEKMGYENSSKRNFAIADENPVLMANMETESSPEPVTSSLPPITTKTNETKVSLIRKEFVLFIKNGFKIK